jgi:phage terminase small subunit
MTSTTGRPEPPSHLSTQARDVWRDVLTRYELEAEELETLRLALEALDRAAQARRALRRHGTTYEDRFGAPHARPEVAIERESRRDYVRLMSALNLPTEEPEQGRDSHGQFTRTPRGQGRVARMKAAG